ncbi:hypothetical protein Vretimale_12072, partial [Volvox reticuliferus]
APVTAAKAGPVGREEQRGPSAAPPRQGRFDDDGEDPTFDAAAMDQGAETEHRTPTVAVTTVRTDRGHGVRGASGSGNRKGSTGTGQRADPAKGKRKGGSPSAAAVHEAKNE